MSTDRKISVYRFRRLEGGRAISPRHMWGTLGAIKTLSGCEPLPETARKVHPKLLENGFYFEHTPTNFVDIEEPARALPTPRSATATF